MSLHRVLIIFLVGQFFHMVAYRLDMACEGLVTLLVVVCAAVVNVCLDRHLRVDDHVALIGEVEDHVGDHAVTILAEYGLSVLFQRHLFLKLDAFLKAHVLKHLAEPQLAEVSLGLVL